MSARRWAAAACGVLTAVAAVATPVQAAGPIITSIYTADPAPLVVGNTMYIYAGRDEAPAGTSNFVMREWHVLSSTDASSWVDTRLTKRGEPLRQWLFHEDSVVRAQLASDEQLRIFGGGAVQAKAPFSFSNERHKVTFGQDALSCPASYS